jgi:hypothetical protein
MDVPHIAPSPHDCVLYLQYVLFIMYYKLYYVICDPYILHSKSRVILLLAPHCTVCTVRTISAIYYMTLHSENSNCILVPHPHCIVAQGCEQQSRTLGGVLIFDERG